MYQNNGFSAIFRGLNSLQNIYIRERKKTNWASWHTETKHHPNTSTWTRLFDGLFLLFFAPHPNRTTRELHTFQWIRFCLCLKARTYDKLTLIYFESHAYIDRSSISSGLALTSSTFLYRAQDESYSGSKYKSTFGYINVRRIVLRLYLL